MGTEERLYRSLQDQIDCLIQVIELKVKDRDREKGRGYVQRTDKKKDNRGGDVLLLLNVMLSHAHFSLRASVLSSQNKIELHDAAVYTKGCSVLLTGW